MPTQSTQFAPGHHWASGELAAFLELTVQAQVTLIAPSSRKTSTTCRHAAVKSAGDWWPAPQEYQPPFISCPKDTMTGWPKARTARANERRYPSQPPADTDARLTTIGCTCTNGKESCCSA